jgi:hypothetical protein
MMRNLFPSIGNATEGDFSLKLPGSDDIKTLLKLWPFAHLFSGTF